MRDMKDSGIEWIGKIPASWSTNYIKNLFYTVAGATPKSERTEYYDGEILWITPADYKTEDMYVSAGKRNITAEGYKSCSTTLVPKNSIIFSKRAPIGTVAINTNELCTNQGCIACVKKEECSEEYYYYVMSVATEHFELLGSGTTFKEISASSFANVKLPFPSEEEQRKIVYYLNNQCKAINALKEDIQSQISSLEEYKRSVITEAVTKGLNADVEMKDSGIEWCPVIPKHWHVVNPKSMFSLRTERARKGERQLTASQKLGIVYQDEFMQSEGQKVVTVEKDFNILKHVEPNDFVISMRSFQGGLEYSELSGSISSAYVMLIPNKDKVYPAFWRWFFKSSKYINAIQSTTNLVRDGQAMRYANFVKVPLFAIPLEEQKEIADYLNIKCKEIDEILTLKKDQLATLEQYKKSLIYEYVTGKKEVPNE